MSQRGKAYTVRVHTRGNPKDVQLLGSFDGEHDLAEVLAEMFADVSSEFESANEAQLLRVESSDMDGDEVRSVFVVGETGVVSDIEDSSGEHVLHMDGEHTQLVRCGSLFILPGSQTQGWWMVHSNSRRSPKGLVAAELRRRFTDEYPDHILKFEPCVAADALKEAVDNDLVNKVTLVLLEEPGDRRIAATNDWVRKEEKAKVALTVQSALTGGHVLGSRLKKFLGGDSDEFTKIVEFEGLEFDEAKVDVTLQNGSKRTFNLSSPGDGYAMSVELENLAYDATGEFTEDSIYDALRAAHSDITT